MSYNHAQRDFIASDIASLTAASTFTDGTANEYDSEEIDVTDIDRVVLQGRVTGENASANGDITFNVLGSLDGVLWDTAIVATVTVTMTGTTQAVKSDPLDVKGYRLLKLGTIGNDDASYAGLLVNLKCGKSYGYIK